MRIRTAAGANLAVKAALIGLLAFAAAASDLPQFEGKGMGVRALTYPVAALVVPIGWWLAGRPRPYPHVVDMLVVLPFLVDTAGNAADLYESIDWFDDAAHFLNWVILVAAFTLVLRRIRLPTAVVVGLGVGFGATTILLWELGEYLVMRLGTGRLHLTYEDTIGDLALSFSGGVVGTLVTVAAARRTA